MAEKQKKRVVFMGTPEFAAIILDKIIASCQYEVAGVYTQPDKKSGRGLKNYIQPVKKLAIQHNLPLFQPENLRSPEIASQLEALKPDYIIVAAYGALLPPNILEIPAIAPVNVHASLLPAYRGAAPIQRAIMEIYGKDACSGISIMKMEAGLDTGPVYAQESVPVQGSYSKDYEQKLAFSGAELLLDTLEKIEQKGLQPVAQNESEATYAHKLEKSDGHIDWNKDAARIDALVRALTPWPGARSMLRFFDNEDEFLVTILEGQAGDATNGEQPGAILRHKKGLSIACADRWYNLARLRPEGRKEMTSAAFANGQCKIKNGLCGTAFACK